MANVYWAIQIYGSKLNKGEHVAALLTYYFFEVVGAAFAAIAVGIGWRSQKDRAEIERSR